MVWIDTFVVFIFHVGNQASGELYALSALKLIADGEMVPNKIGKDGQSRILIVRLPYEVEVCEYGMHL